MKPLLPTFYHILHCHEQNLLRPLWAEEALLTYFEVIVKKKKEVFWQPRKKKFDMPWIKQSLLFLCTQKWRNFLCCSCLKDRVSQNPVIKFLVLSLTGPSRNRNWLRQEYAALYNAFFFSVSSRLRKRAFRCPSLPELLLLALARVLGKRRV